ncbi:MAG: AAA family ATPase [Pseudomonadota bacterium]
MILKHAKIRGYRRFRNETTVSFSPSLTALVGPNEAGKTSFLSALHDFQNDNVQESDVSYGHTGETSLQLCFLLNEDECNELGLSRNSWFEYTYVYNEDLNNRFSINPEPIEDFDTQNKLFKQIKKAIRYKRVKGYFPLTRANNEGIIHHDDILQILNRVNERIDEEDFDALEELSKIFDNLEENDPLAELGDQVSQFISSKKDYDHARTILRKLKPLIPEFRFYDPVENDLGMPYNFSSLFGDENNIKKPTAGMQALFDEFDVDIKTLASLIRSGDSAPTQGLIDHVNIKLRNFPLGKWSQSDVYLKIVPRNPYIDLLVVNSDGFSVTRQYNNFDQRSDGYKRFISLQTFLMLNKSSSEIILLMDELEQHLHYDAQADLISALSEDTEIQQVIYSTHSVGSLPPDLGNGVRLVKWDDEKRENSTVVNKFWANDDAEGFDPLLYGMGATTMAFFPTKRVVFAEGATEMLLLPTLFQEALDLKVLPFQVVHGLSNMNDSSLQLAGNKVSGAFFIVDGDGGGETIKKNLVGAGVNAERIFSLGKGKKLITVEDAVSDGIWIDAVNMHIDSYYSGQMERIETCPKKGRINELHKKLRAGKIDIAYCILDIIRKNPDRTVLSTSGRTRLKQIYDAIIPALIEE